MSPDDYLYIRLEATEGGVAVVTLNRPDVHNAFNGEVIDELSNAFDMLADQTSIRMVILRIEV